MPETMSSSMFRAGEEMMDDRIRMKRNSTIKEAIKLTKQVVEVIKGVEIILDVRILVMTRMVVPRLLGIELLNVKP